MTTAGVFLFCAAAGLTTYAFLRVPSWFCSAINRSSLWRVRDDVWDARRAGAIPDNAAVTRLLERLEMFILAVPHIGPVQLWWFKRIAPDLDVNVRPVLLDTGPMSEAEYKRFRGFELEFIRIVMRQYMTGSWAGIFLVAPRRPTDLLTLLRGGPIAVQIPDRPGADGRADQSPDPTVVADLERAVPHFLRSHDLVEAAG